MRQRCKCAKSMVIATGFVLMAGAAGAAPGNPDVSIPKANPYIAIQILDPLGFASPQNDNIKISTSGNTLSIAGGVAIAPIMSRPAKPTTSGLEIKAEADNADTGASAIAFGNVGAGLGGKQFHSYPFPATESTVTNTGVLSVSSVAESQFPNVDMQAYKTELNRLEGLPSGDPEYLFGFSKKVASALGNNLPASIPSVSAAAGLVALGAKNAAAIQQGGDASVSATGRGMAAAGALGLAAVSWKDGGVSTVKVKSDLNVTAQSEGRGLAAAVAGLSVARAGTARLESTGATNVAAEATDPSSASIAAAGGLAVMAAGGPGKGTGVLNIGGPLAVEAASNGAKYATSQNVGQMTAALSNLPLVGNLTNALPAGLKALRLPSGALAGGGLAFTNYGSAISVNNDVTVKARGQGKGDVALAGGLAALTRRGGPATVALNGGTLAVEATSDKRGLAMAGGALALVSQKNSPQDAAGDATLTAAEGTAVKVSGKAIDQASASSYGLAGGLAAASSSGKGIVKTAASLSVSASSNGGRGTAGNLKKLTDALTGLDEANGLKAFAEQPVIEDNGSLALAVGAAASGAKGGELVNTGAVNVAATGLGEDDATGVGLAALSPQGDMTLVNRGAVTVSAEGRQGMALGLISHGKGLSKVEVGGPVEVSAASKGKSAFALGVGSFCTTDMTVDAPINATATGSGSLGAIGVMSGPGTVSATAQGIVKASAEGDASAHQLFALPGNGQVNLKSWNVALEEYQPRKTPFAIGRTAGEKGILNFDKAIIRVTPGKAFDFGRRYYFKDMMTSYALSASTDWNKPENWTLETPVDPSAAGGQVEALGIVASVFTPHPMFAPYLGIDTSLPENPGKDILRQFVGIQMNDAANPALTANFAARSLTERQAFGIQRSLGDLDIPDDAKWHFFAIPSYSYTKWNGGNAFETKGGGILLGAARGTDESGIGFHAGFESNSMHSKESLVDDDSKSFIAGAHVWRNLSDKFWLRGQLTGISTRDKLHFGSCDAGFGSDEKTNNWGAFASVTAGHDLIRQERAQLSAEIGLAWLYGGTSAYDFSLGENLPVSAKSSHRGDLFGTVNLRWTGKYGDSETSSFEPNVALGIRQSFTDNETTLPFTVGSGAFYGARQADRTVGTFEVGLDWRLRNMLLGLSYYGEKGSDSSSQMGRLNLRFDM